MPRASDKPHGRGLSSRVLLCAVGAGVLAGSRTDANGSPVKSYVKDLIRVGPWRDPRTGDTFNVTTEDLDRWAGEFSRMKANGVRVPVPEGHTDEASANRGYVEGMFHDGTTLFGNIDLIGEDAIAMASRTEVSIYAPASLTDGQGVKYDNPIAHVALTPVPVISGQGGFVPITASRGGTESVPAYRLCQGENMNQHLLSLAKLHGVDTSTFTTDQQIHDALAAKMKGGDKGDGAGTPAAVAYARERDEAKQALQLARNEIEALKKGGEAEHSPLVLKLSRQSRSAQLDALVPAGGNAMKAFVEAQKKRWCPADDKALALSLSPSADSMFDGLVEDLKLIDFKVLSEKNPRTLDRVVPGDSETEKEDAATRARLLSHSSRSTVKAS